MANPQQPELARSRKTPHQDQDSVAGVIDGQHDVSTSAPRGPVPPENQPGNHPEQEQDKPDLDAFAQKLGIVEGDGEEGGNASPSGEGRVQETVQTVQSASSKSGPLAGGAAALSVLALGVGLLLSRKRRRSRHH